MELYEGIYLKRLPISVTLPEKCIEWLDSQVKSRTYHNRSHAVEMMILKGMEMESANQ